MTGFLCSLSFLAGGVLVALVIRANSGKAIAWLNKVTTKAKAKAEARWNDITGR